MVRRGARGSLAHDRLRAALDAGVDARIEAWLHAAADHPVALNFPEGEYLKGLLLRVNA